MKSLCFIVLILAMSRNLPAQAQLDVVADVVQFRGSGAETLWELQYSFSDTTLKYVVAPTGFVGEVLCSLVVRKDTALVASDVWIAAAESNTSQPAHNKFYSGIRTLSLPPGSFSVTFDAADVNDPTRRLKTTFTTQVPVTSARAQMSDIMFVMPKESSALSRFNRAGQPCDPNPRHEITGLSPVLAL